MRVSALVQSLRRLFRQPLHEPEAEARRIEAIRREVAAMGDGVERAIARAGSAPTLLFGFPFESALGAEVCGKNPYSDMMARYPEAPPWPASIKVRSSSGASFVFRVRSFAAYFAASQYMTWESLKELRRSIAG